MDFEQLLESAQHASRLLKSLANERRLLVLCHLSQGEKSVGELERLVDLSQSVLSQHLARLRRDNLVKTRREAQTIYYSVSSPEALAVLESLYRVFCGNGAERQPGRSDRARHEPDRITTPTRRGRSR